MREVRDAGGRVVGRARTMAAAHRSTRRLELNRRFGGGHTYNRAGGSLEEEFVRRVDGLLAHSPDNPPPEEVAEFRRWLVSNFHFQTRATPRGFKREKEELDRLWRALASGEEPYGNIPGAVTRSIANLWTQMRPMVPTWVSVFSSSEGRARAITREVREGANRYVNMVGASDGNLAEMVRTIEGVFASLRGWRTNALDGGITVVFAGPKDFRGTSSGKYRRETDELWIRSTPGGRVAKAGAGYGGLAYVIVHEIGHRYEARVAAMSDFDRSEWHTSRYSSTEGEAFAELFAITNFGIEGQGNPATLERFEAVMEGWNHALRPRLPAHLARFRAPSTY